MRCLAKSSSSLTLLIFAMFSSRKTISSKLRNFRPPSVIFLFLYLRWAVAQRLRRMPNSSFFAWKSLQLRQLLKSSSTQPPQTIPIKRSTSSSSTPSRYSRAVPSLLVRYSSSSLACLPTRYAFSSSDSSLLGGSSSSKKWTCRDSLVCRGEGLRGVALSCSSLTLMRALSLPFIILILIFHKSAAAHLTPNRRLMLPHNKGGCLWGYSIIRVSQIQWRIIRLQMGKKLLKQPAARRTSTRVIKKKQHPDDHYYDDDEDNEDHSPHDDSSDSDQDSSSEGEGEQDGDSSSPTPLQPENMAIRNMQFRERRGTKMNYLINRKKEEEEDPFWAAQGQQYFGDLDDGDNDEEDYVESSSGRDEFDSDFDQTESDHEGEQGPEGEEEREVDEQHEKEKRRRQDLMRRIEAPAPPKRSAKSANSSKKNQKQKQKNEQQQAASRYIHMAFNQEQLLGEAATTEYYNWLSLKKLISIETERKDFTKRSHHIEGPKVVYRDRIGAAGVREETYELQDVEVREVGDLTRIMNQN